MLKQIPVKKEYLLIAATLILLLVSYRFAYKNTIEAWALNKELIIKLAQSNDLSYQPGYLERQEANLNKIVNSYKADTALFRSNIISTIAAIAEKENVKLTGVPVQDAAYHTDHFIVEKLEFEGDFFSLVKVADQLQNTQNIGIMRCEDFKTISDRSGTNEVKKLVLEIYLEILR